MFRIKNKMFTWKKVKRLPGSYHRQAKKEFLKMMSVSMPEINNQIAPIPSDANDDDDNSIDIPVLENLPDSDDNNEQLSENDEMYCHEDNDIIVEDDDPDNMSITSEEVDFPADEISRNADLRSDIPAWSLKHNINHGALRDMIAVINKFAGKELLPKDPRTLLQTPRTVEIQSLPNNEQYWHNGLKFCLENVFSNISESIAISLNFNMDGLPLFRSARKEFWPILCNITEMPWIKPMVIGIYYIQAKASSLKAFLTPLVEELKPICDQGIGVNGHHIHVKIRSFICDSPARAFIKGVANFNGQNGCLKCTTVGDYSYVSHTNILPRVDCPKRTDEGFRARIYGEHHKIDSPLLNLDIDMIDQIPIADSLHLLHLGVMRRMLFGWRDGSFKNSGTKWPDATTTAVSNFLRKCKMPREIHRAMRGLELLSYWKGTEYRTFLMYVGIVALKDNTSYEIYQHFLQLFCAVTICESREFSHLLQLAKVLIEHYIEEFIHIYGLHYMTSNFHNLSHMVDDVMKFGDLQSISSYPFENLLGYIKSLMRNGTRPLPQIAKRLMEITKTSGCARMNVDLTQLHLTMPNNGQNVPKNFHLVSESSNEFYSKIDFGNFSLSTDVANKWFLTHNNEIVCLKNILSVGVNKMSLFGSSVPGLVDFFQQPIKSSALNIYATEYFVAENCLDFKLFNVADIKYKLVRIEYNDNTDVFVPLLHTIS